MSIKSKFVEGAAFGAGFALAASLVAWLAFLVFASHTVSEGGVTVYSSPPVLSSVERETESNPLAKELSLEELIKKATFIAIARFEAAPDGKRRAIVKEFLKETPGSKINYKIGDEFTFSSYYPQPGQDRGDGVVIFFVGSPATMTRTTNFYGDRIPGFAEIPLELFRRKCRGET